MDLRNSEPRGAKHRRISVIALAAALAACTTQQQDDARRNVQQAYKSAPSDVRNAYIAGAVDTALTAVDIDAATGVKVSAIDGVVTLSGKAHDAAERARYIEAAKAVDGVTSVRNLLALDPHLQGPREQAANAALEARASAAIAAQAGINVFHVTVTANAGDVTLHGTVPSPSIDKTIVDTARSVEGINKVDDQLVVGNKRT